MYTHVNIYMYIHMLYVYMTLHPDRTFEVILQVGDLPDAREEHQDAAGGLNKGIGLRVNG